MDEKRPDAPGEQEIAAVTSRPLTDEDKYYLERAYKEPVERLGRLEDVAKFLITGTATVSGLFLAALKLAIGSKTPGCGLIGPFVLWSLAILALLLVLMPFRYRTGQNAPGSWKDAYRQAGHRKYVWLWIGAALFIAGLLCGAVLLIL